MASPRPYSRGLAIIAGTLVGWVGGALISRVGYALVVRGLEMSDFEIFGYGLVLIIFVVALVILWLATSQRD